MTVDLAAMELQADDVALLATRASRGDASSFDALYRRFARSVHGVLLSRLPPRDAEELVQEVFLLAHRRIGALEDPAAFGPWIHAIARNAAIDRLRLHGRRPSVEPLRDVAAPANDGELAERVLHHIQSLPEAYRETLALRLVEGLTGPEIARQTGLTPESVRVNLCRGMELLRPLLRKEGWP